MNLNDLVFAIGQAVLVVSLIPTLRASEKPAPSTSLIGAAVLTAFAIDQATLGLYYAMVTTGITAVLWFILFLQAKVA